MIKLGDDERLLVMDRQKIEDDFYNRIFSDANANKDLTDDPVIDGTLETESRQSYKRTKFPPIDTRIKVDGKSLPFSFIPEFFGRLSAPDESRINEDIVERMINCYVRTNCLYRGTFEIDGDAYHIWLSDDNCNGVFGEKFELMRFERPISGRIPIFAIGDGIFLSSDEEIQQHGQQAIGDWLLVGNRLFEVTISQAKERMSLTPVVKNLVPLELAMQPEHVSLYTEGGKHFLMTCRPDKKINIPRGRYRLYNYSLLKKDDQGDLWSVTARATTECPWINVDGSANIALKFGEPYIAAVDVPERGVINVQGSTSAQSSVFLLFTIRGQGNEDISEISHEKGDKTKIPFSKNEGMIHRPEEPTY